MKRFLSLAVAFLLLASGAVWFSGCGSDVEVAREYVYIGGIPMTSAIVRSKEVRAYVDKVSAALQAGDFSKIRELGNGLGDVEKALKSGRTFLRSAASSYSRIDTLEGVANYCTYKGMMVTVIGLYADALDAAESLLLSLKQFYSDAGSGRRVDHAAQADRARSAAAEMDEKLAAAEKLRGKTRDFARKYGL